MGEVLLCKDLTIGREVATKRILPGRASDAAERSQFIREAQIQGQLEHPSIVPVYDLTVSSDGAVFFTMKRLRGRTLEDILKGLQAGRSEDVAAFPRHRLLSALASVCLAVEFAHSRGVLHRDLKPANIMLGDFGEVYVLDWGIAKVRHGDDGNGVRVQQPAEAQATQTGQIVGTLAYISPEQAAGVPGAIDRRSDVFTLGAILFEVLTFERLRKSGPQPLMLLAIHEGENARPSQRAPASAVPPELEEICVRATLREPAKRYQTARELHGAIEKYIAGERDVELRQQLAAQHSSAAAGFIERALASGTEAEGARRTALAEVGRALALDPTNSTALQVLRRILTEPPHELPTEVEGRIRAELAQEELVRLRGLLISGLGIPFLIGVIFLMGVRDWPLMTALVMLAAVSISLRLYTSRQVEITAWHYLSQLFTYGFFACCGRILGPLWLMLFMVIPHCIGYAFSSNAPLRRFSMLSASVFVAGMFALEHLGVLQPSYRFEGGNLVVVSNLTALPSLWTQVLVFGMGQLCIWLSFVSIGRLPKLRLQAERRVALQTWHLRQLLPDSGRPIAGIQDAMSTQRPTGGRNGTADERHSGAHAPSRRP